MNCEEVQGESATPEQIELRRERAWRDLAEVGVRMLFPCLQHNQAGPCPKYKEGMEEDGGGKDDDKERPQMAGRPGAHYSRGPQDSGVVIRAVGSGTLTRWAATLAPATAALGGCT